MSAMHCMGCDADVQPSIDIGENGRPRSVCPKCQQVLGSALAATDQPEPPPSAARPVDGTPSRARLATLLAVAPTDLVGAAKARLLVIDTELTRLAGLQREQRKLAAMIDAAEAAELADPDPNAAPAAQPLTDAAE